jgi:nucleoside-diphosphate-sugar epimerase
MTRSPNKAAALAVEGAEPIVCDVFDRPALAAAVRAFAPDVMLHELTDLPDNREELPEDSIGNARIRLEGTRNLLDATRGLGYVKVLAQSIAWSMRPGAEATAVEALERAVLAVNGVVLRYGLFYGPGTYFEQSPPDGPRVHIDTAAIRTVKAIDAPPGILTIVDRDAPA